MNRRGFFSTLAKAAAGFTILPAATTYEQIWRVQREPIIVAWYNRLPYWIALQERRRLFASESVFQFLPAFTEFTTKPFPPNMGEVISTTKTIN